MAAKQARIERRVWDPTTQRFAATGETMEGDAATLEQLAAALPGKALIVGLCLWRLAGATNNRTVVLGNRELSPFGIDRAAKSRALAALEGAGLITVARRASRFPVVTLPAARAASRPACSTSSAARR